MGNETSHSIVRASSGFRVHETATGLWDFSLGLKTPNRIHAPFNQFRNIGVAVAIVLAPLTSFADPWFIDRRRQTAGTSHVVMEFGMVRRLTLQAARQVALTLLAKMEAARLKTIEEEARRSMDLEDYG